jgi:hypothetical protein
MNFRSLSGSSAFDGSIGPLIARSREGIVGSAPQGVTSRCNIRGPRRSPARRVGSATRLRTREWLRSQVLARVQRDGHETGTHEVLEGLRPIRFRGVPAPNAKLRAPVVLPGNEGEGSALPVSESQPDEPQSDELHDPHRRDAGHRAHPRAPRIVGAGAAALTCPRPDVAIGRTGPHAGACRSPPTHPDINGGLGDVSVGDTSRSEQSHGHGRTAALGRVLPATSVARAAAMQHIADIQRDAGTVGFGSKVHLHRPPCGHADPLRSLVDQLGFAPANRSFAPDRRSRSRSRRQRRTGLESPRRPLRRGKFGRMSAERTVIVRSRPLPAARDGRLPGTRLGRACLLFRLPSQLIAPAPSAAGLQGTARARNGSISAPRCAPQAPRCAPMA